jgi:hypothetical protein
MASRRLFGTIAVVASFLALLAVLVGPSAVDAMSPKPPMEERVADKVVAIRDSIKARLKNEPRQPPTLEQRFHKEELPYSISLALAAVGIIGGCIAYLRREDHRLVYVACGVATLTLLWHAVLMALGALIICAIIFSFFGGATS